MKLRTKYILFILLIHLFMALFFIKYISVSKSEGGRFLSIIEYSGDPFVILGEGIFVITIILSILLYKGLISPIKLITDGTEAIKDKDFNIKFLKVGHKELDQLIDTYNRMIDTLHKERVSQQEKNYLLEKLINNSPTGIIILDKNRKIYSINPASSSLLSLSEDKLLGSTLDEVDHPLFAKVSQLEENGVEVFNFNNVTIFRVFKGGFVDKGFQHQFLLIEDLSKEILRSEKQAYEKIIRIMSHEINNSIGAVNSILNSFKYYQNQLNSSDQKDYGEALDVSITRNRNLATFMKNYADIVKLPRPNIKNTDITSLVRSVVRLFKEGNSDIEWSLKSEDQVFGEIDPLLMEQVFINIIKNGVEAIRGVNSSDTGIVMVEVKSIGNSVSEIVISNNGLPITDDIEDKLFSSFFSSKPNGQGVGLTLIREILSDHDLRFSLKTDKDDGFTKFRIKF